MNYPNLTYNNDFGARLARNLKEGLSAGQQLRFAAKGYTDKAVEQDLEGQALRNQERRGEIDLQPLKRKNLELTQKTLDLQLKDAERKMGIDQMSPLQFKALEGTADPETGLFLDSKPPVRGYNEQGQPILSDAETVTKLPDGRRIMFSPRAKQIAMHFKQQKIAQAARSPSSAFQLKDELGQPVGTEVVTNNPDGTTTRKIQPPPKPTPPPKIDPNDITVQWQNYWNTRQSLKARLAEAGQSGNPVAIQDAREALASFEQVWQKRLDHMAKQTYDPAAYAEVEEGVDSLGAPTRKIKRKVPVAELGNYAAGGSATPAPGASPPSTVNTPVPTNLNPTTGQYIPNKTTVQRNGKTWLYIGNDQWEEQ